ncbi:MAG: class I SAM-dependent DNA methyltransferase [Armatimonadetes bacterium]|nr:class I SAM-dependent DNA methyltransferase [Armatimonadota bacterium]
MTPTELAAKWSRVQLRERQACQEHFLDVCRLVGHPTPAEADPTGEEFCFERGAGRTSGGDGWADVWKRGHFGWEYKGRHVNLDAAYRQLLDYREALENPPLLVVCDTERFVIHTNFTNTIKKTFDIRLDCLHHPNNLRTLHAVFHAPDTLKPDRTPDQLTAEVAAAIGELAQRLYQRGVGRHEAAHYLMRLVFCLFAEDIGLLPAGMITDTARHFSREPAAFNAIIAELFAAMATGGRLGRELIDYFDGGLFDATPSTVELATEDIVALGQVARDDWSQIEPSIFGSLFQQGLDPEQRAGLGAHYTGREYIERLVDPVVMTPLQREWAAARAECDALNEQIQRLSGRARAARRQALERRINDFMDRLAAVTVLDPACGSGNFLYVALHRLKDLELEVIRACARWEGVQPPYPRVNPACLYGIEIDEYAVELARLTVWIGYLQWLKANGYMPSDRPLLKPLENIAEANAILAYDAAGRPVDPPWPEVEFIVGNPPHLAGNHIRYRALGTRADDLFELYRDRLPAMADLCCYWFERARAQLAEGKATRVGLLGTAKLVLPSNRVVLQRICETGGIFMAWPNEVWPFPDAAHRVALIGFDDGSDPSRTLNSQPVDEIGPLLVDGVDVTQARPLRGNGGIAFVGDTKGGAFDIPGEVAGAWLDAPNPMGRSNRDVLRPWRNARDLAGRPSGRWIVDFPVDVTEEDAALYEAPFEYLRGAVLPVRSRARRAHRRTRWWLHNEPAKQMRAATSGLSRYLATPAVCSHRYWLWLPPEVLCDHRVVVVARADDYAFGVLHSRPQVLWSQAQHLRHGKGDDPIFTVTDCFLPFPWPLPTAEQRDAISAAARALDEQRNSRVRTSDITLTTLYNERPTWLDNLHRRIDEAVLAAYGWPADLSDDDLLARLLALNLERAEQEEAGVILRP